ncbi:MAG: molybdopterin-guanine dinucleotide biosynthesis protein B [Nitriliruptoraceae bacterium]
MPIIAIVGNSGSGKTLLAEQLVAALDAEGLRVAYVKHAVHGFEPGRSGSDSERVRKAGADPVVVMDPDGLLEVTGSSEELLAQLLTGLRGDVVLLEGFSSGPWPKLRVTVDGAAPRDVAEPVLFDLDRSRDERFPDAAIRSVTDVIKGRRAAIGSAHATLYADGREVPLRGFAQTIVASAARGLLGSLRGVDDADRLVLELRRGEDHDERGT